MSQPDEPSFHVKQPNPLTDKFRVEGLFAQALFEHVAWSYDLTLLGEKFALLDEDELKARGYDPNATDLLIVKRVSDGKCFELEIDVTASEADPVIDPENPPPIPGQTELF
jgi:hypothetical protein